MKRIFDLLLCVPFILIITPVFLILVGLAYINLGSPVFFCQKRPGFKGKPFTMIKFRTMTDARDPEGNMLPDGLRLSSFGRFLRISSLDELPGLWNVLKGDMSLVGPRPLLMEYLELYSPEQARRHDVKPGITGWAQVNGRNTISWDDRFKLDVWYVDNRTVWLDLKILFMTVIRVFRHEDINQPGQATMSKFRGSKEDVSR